MSLHIEVFITGPLQVSCSVVTDTENKQSVVIDPGGSTDDITGHIQSQGSSLVAILLTHAHFDHIAGLTGLASSNKEKSIDIYMHDGDQYLIDNAATQAARFGMSISPKLPKVTHKVTDNEKLTFGSIKIDTLHTPGHSPGSVCYYLPSEKTLFSGDTIFQNSIGRTDLWGGDFQQLIDGVKEKVLTLPEETIIIPGHGPQTTVQHEIKSNPFFK
ncbi:MAG: MBL fold metallo-hydrolase [Leptospirales bacterium]